MSKLGDAIGRSGAADEAENTRAAMGARTEQGIQQLADQFGSVCDLSPRQLEMVKLALAGVHRKEAAARLGCSLKTIEGYWKRIYEKTGCGSQAEVVARFIRETFCAAIDERFAA